jgi:hypothetical protein
MSNPAVKLGSIGNLRDFSVEQSGEGLAWQRQNANPFAAQVSTQDKYNKVEAFNIWPQEGWDAGVSKTDPEAGGFLYADAETRVPSQVILSPLIHQVDNRTLTHAPQDCRYMPDNMAGEVTVGNGGHAKVAIKFIAPASGGLSTFVAWVYANIASSVQIKFEIWSDSSGPGSLVSTPVTYTPPESTPGWYWHGTTVTKALSGGTSYWLVIYPTSGSDSFQMGYGSSGYTVNSQRFTSVWSDINPNTYLFYSLGLYPNTVSPLYSGSGFFRLGSTLYHFSDNRVWKYSTANDSWSSVGALTSGADSMLSVSGVSTWNDKAWFGSGGLSNDKTLTMDTSETIATPALNGNIFTKFGPYLYRSYQNDLYRSGDGVSWDGPFPIGSDQYNITGMAGMGDSLYVATAEALYRFAPGDIVDGVTTWGNIDATNGKGMINHAGALYIPIRGRIATFTQDGRLMDVWMNGEDDVITGRIGQVWHLTNMNNWLVALVSNPTAAGKPTLWAYQDGSWHHLATLPSGGAFSAAGVYSSYAAYYDRSTQSLWVSTPALVTYRLYVPDYTLNPYNDSASTFMPRGWLEQARFFGGLYLNNKRFQSVTIVGDSLSANQFVDVYWRDAARGWTKLGRVTADGQELRWGDIDVNLVTGWIRLGVLLGTTSGGSTPRIRAIITKMLPMVNDRFTDQITILMSDHVEMSDGAPSAYTTQQAWDFLTGPDVIANEGSVIYQDPWGEQYEVTVKAHNELITKFAYYNNALHVKEFRMTLTVEQITLGTYTP